MSKSAEHAKGGADEDSANQEHPGHSHEAGARHRFSSFGARAHESDGGDKEDGEAKPHE